MVFMRGAGIVRLRPPSRLEWIDRQGNSQPLTEAPQGWEAVAISPNGKLVAGSIEESGRGPRRFDIWLYDLERRTLTRLTSDGVNRIPVWTPDGRWVTYSSIGADGTKNGIYRVPADKSGPPELLLAPDKGSSIWPASWTPDGKTLIYRQTSVDFKGKIWILLRRGAARKPSRGCFRDRRLMKPVRPCRRMGSGSPTLLTNPASSR
jgi:dipeptidyl aminopeptidase/acylaminoacyl peptidase